MSNNKENFAPKDKITGENKLESSQRYFASLRETLQAELDSAQDPEKKKEYQELYAAVENKLSDLKTKGKEVIQATGQSYSERIKAMKSSSDDIGDFKAGLDQKKKALLEKAEEGLSATAPKLEKQIATGTEKAQAKAKEFSDTLRASNMPEGAKAAMNDMDKMVKTSQTITTKVIEKVGNAVADAIETLANLPNKIIQAFINFFKNIGTWLGIEGAASAADDLKAKAEGVTKDGKDLVKKGEAAMQTAEASKDDIERAFTDAKTAINEFVAIPKNGSEKKYNEALAKCKSSMATLYRIKDRLTPEQRKMVDELESKLPWNPETLLDPEKKDKWIESQIGNVAKKISDEFYSGGDLSPEQISLVREGLKKMHFGQDTIAKLKARMENPNDNTAASFSDGSDFLLELMLGNTEMLGIMFRVVPWYRFGWTVAKKTVSEGVETYEYNLSLVFNKLRWVEPPKMTFTSDSLVSKVQELKNDPVAHDMLLMQMYRVNGLFASIAGAAVGGVFSAFYMAVDNSHGGDGFKDFQKVLGKKYDGLAGEVQKIENSFSGNSRFKPELAQTIRNELEVMKKNWLLLSLAQEGQNDPAKITQLLNKPEYQNLGITEAELSKNSHNVRGFLASKMSAEWVNASALSRLPGRVFGTSAGAGGDLISHVQDVKRFQVSLMKNDSISRLRELWWSLKVLTFARHADKTLLHFKDIDSATNTLRQLWAHGGNLLSEMLRGLPVAGLVIGGVDLATQDVRNLTQSEKWKSFMSVAATVLLPFWSMALLTDKETAPRINKNGEIENIGTWIAAVGMLSVDGLLLANAVRTGNVVDFFLQRPKDVLHTIGSINRMNTVIARATPRMVNPKWIESAEKVAGKGGKKVKTIAAALAAFTVGWYAYAASEKDFELELAKKWYWDPKSGDITEKAISEFANMDAKAKKWFADNLSHAIFDGEKSLANAKSDVDVNGMYTLIVETPEQAKTWWTALNAKQRLFSDELAKLGMGVDVLDYETFKKNKEKASK